ncbi:BZ3500_MvSof-1268-A1-R1_Chr4-1g06808 [Microbotryum saponariae]|uniref:BZ3500_MvSof-1268-A1-R1_Chr4-1g06808 protein n=1 Tax=Microbotryum saponariae TaxID=289078 RepID=A0A2X0MX77_9BASI|nr:BZ3500_MvSof-1268-A1-R1_Chr4-1g06808 [Microbotryum saponariae]SDA06465.1 BZ3501_MvSof-1269-A2-R1_Chr4-1g06510 [Microbotryum saponariae]
MASVKIASLFLRTLSKPIANRLKKQAKEHERFREMTISFAQFLHRSEMRMRVSLLGETHPVVVRPLNDARAIDAGANFISETFLFAFAASIILAENWRSRRAEGKRRDQVQDQLEAHEERLAQLSLDLEKERKERTEGLLREEKLENIVEQIVEIGIRGGFLVNPSPAWISHVHAGDMARSLERSDHTVAWSSNGQAASTVIAELEKLKSRPVRVDAASEVNDTKH